MIFTNLARAKARRFGMFCRASADQTRLVFYTGNEAEPGSWLEAGSTMIDTSHGDAAVSNNAVELIIGQS